MIADLIAWQGPCNLLEAKWNDRDGTMVKFRLMDVDENSRNPFVMFTKRRKGKAGTRFRASMVPTDKPELHIYNDEAMLAGWGDSQNGGMTVTFWLAEDRMGHPFQGWPREHEFMVVLVELDEAEEPVNQKMRAKVDASAVRPSQRLSYNCAMLCRQPLFREWLMKEVLPTVPLIDDPGRIEDEDEAAEFVREHLDIASRSQLDTDPKVAERYKASILHPYEDWVKRRGDY